MEVCMNRKPLTIVNQDEILKSIMVQMDDCHEEIDMCERDISMRVQQLFETEIVPILAKRLKPLKDGEQLIWRKVEERLREIGFQVNEDTPLSYDDGVIFYHSEGEDKTDPASIKEMVMNSILKGINK
jgi:hypothetical protein